MSCSTSHSTAVVVPVGTSFAPVTTWVGPLGLYVIRVHAKTPVRATVRWSEGEQVTDEVTFDVIGHATLVLPASQVSVDAYAHLSDSRVEVGIVPTSSWVPTEVSRWVPVDTGTSDSDTTTALKPPRHTDRVDIIPSDPAETFTVEVFDESNTSIGQWTQDTIPAGGAPAGRAVRTTITTSAPVRLRYTLKV